VLKVNRKSLLYHNNNPIALAPWAYLKQQDEQRLLTDKNAQLWLIEQYTVRYC
jgi:hemolysin-activating ACP:hemolysin acyltransferase